MPNDTTTPDRGYTIDEAFAVAIRYARFAIPIEEARQALAEEKAIIDADFEVLEAA